MALQNSGGATPLREAQDTFEYRTASARAQHFSKLSGFVARDIDTISDFCVGKDLLLISRCPDYNANRYVDEVRSGDFRMKPSHIKKKTGAYGVLFWGGRGYVSDYDLMCVHKLNRSTGKYEALQMSWDGRRTMTAVEEDIIGRLNRRLVFKIQHGCNDNFAVRWADGSNPMPKVKNIGDEFLVFRHNDISFVGSKFALKTKFYDRFGLSGWHPVYGW